MTLWPRILGWLRAFAARFGVLRGAVRELWIIFGAKLLAILAYGVMNSTLVLWLSSDLGYGDVEAGSLVALWSTVMTICTVLVGSLVDAIGLRKAFLLGFCVCLGARGVMTFASAKGLALGGGLFPLAVGEALMTPVMVAAVRRYSTTAQRSIAFSIFYAMMNVGFGLGSWIFDTVRTALGEYGHYTLPVLGTHLSTYRTLFLISFLLTLPNVGIVYFLLRGGVEATDEGVKITPERPKYPRENLFKALGLMTRDALVETGRIFAGLWGQPAFYKFLAFLALAVPVRLIFYHMYYTYPKFGIRELGEGAPIGRLWAINSLTVVVLVPIVGALTQRIRAYRMVVVGSLVSGLSVFLMAMPPGWFQPLADGWLGHRIANAWLGGYEKFSVEDVRDLPGLARQLLNPSNQVTVYLVQQLSGRTTALLNREAAGGFRPPSTDPHPSSALFWPADIADAPGLVGRLSQDTNPATQPVSQFVWEGFSGASRATLTNALAPVGQRQTVLAAELNRVLQGKSFYEERRFAGVRLSEGARSCVEASRQKDAPARFKQSQALHRLLLEDSYPAHLARSRHPLRLALAEDFSRLIQGPLLFAPERFAEVRLSAPTQRALDHPGTGRERTRLNRLLLEDSFPQVLAQNRVGVRGSVSPYYLMIFLYVLLLSVGESLWSPRLYEYTAAVAPKGQEASYMSLSYLPFFVAKFFVGMFSGFLLDWFCPATGPRQPSLLWLIIALTTLITPVGLLVLRRYIRVQEAGRGE